MEASSKSAGSKWEHKINRNLQTFNFFKELIQYYYQLKQNFTYSCALQTNGIKVVFLLKCFEIAYFL